jgi:hypothetical protein
LSIINKTGPYPQSTAAFGLYPKGNKRSRKDVKMNCFIPHFLEKYTGEKAYV